MHGGETSALFEPASEAERGVVFVCAHGAGGDMHHRRMAELSLRLREQGLDVVRFNFLYRERGSRRPDAMPQLKECFKAIVTRTREAAGKKKLIIGGRSMGGRAASILAAEGFACDGLLILAYPLHPAGRPEKLRDAHLAQIRVPALCINGTRDALCRRDLMEKANPPWRMHWVEGADHALEFDDALARLVGAWAATL